MRVISGSAKGARLAPVPRGTRPLSDRAREGLFSSLAGEVPGAACLDLYAGTGAVGIEALSRGAASCVFVEAAADAVRAVRENLERTGLAERAEVVRADVRRFLEGTDRAFDLAFLDPPYAEEPDAIAQVTALVADRIARDGAFVLTRPKHGDSTDVVPIHWAAAKLLRYGDARILVCRREP